MGLCPSGVLSEWGLVRVELCPVGLCLSGVLSSGVMSVYQLFSWFDQKVNKFKVKG